MRDGIGNLLSLPDIPGKDHGIRSRCCADFQPEAKAGADQGAGRQHQRIHPFFPFGQRRFRLTQRRMNHETHSCSKDNRRDQKLEKGDVSVSN